MILQHQNDYQKNEKWLSYISGLYYNQEENWLDHVNTYKQRVNEITNKDIVNFMNQYFDINHFVKMELYPEAMKN